MLTPTSLPPEGTQPESVPVLPQSLNLPAHGVEHGVASSRDQLAPILSASTDAVAEMAQEHAAAREARKVASKPTEPIPSVPDLPVAQPVTLSVPRTETGVRESATDGAVAAGIGAAGASVLYPYGTNILAPMVANTFAHGVVPPASALGYTLGIPAAGAAVGYYVGGKLKHPTAGMLAGLGAGTAAAIAFTPMPQLAAVGALPPLAGLLPGSLGIAVLGPVGLSTIVPAAAGIGAGLYGLGRWHGKVWASEPAGLLKTMARGLVSPVSIPVGYLVKLRGRKA